MKKLIYTATLLTLFTVAGKAQSVTKEQEPTKKEASESVQTKPSQIQKGENTSNNPSKSGTRMAITEKGVPASKGSASSKEKKEDKSTSPGQPTSSEKH